MDGSKKFKSLSPTLCRYWTFRHLLSTDGQLLFYTNRLVVPAACCNNILQILHAAYSGTTKMKQVARQVVFWPGMSTQVEAYIAQCQTCQRYQTNNSKETLQLLPLTTRPFQRVSILNCIRLILMLAGNRTHSK